MKKPVFISLTALFGILLLADCASHRSFSGNGPVHSLKAIFKDDFRIGTALNTTQIEEKDPAVDALIQEQFNTVTPENIMKAEIIHPEWSRYDFTQADRLVAYAKKHHMTVNAHTLIWHSQLPSFMHTMQNTDSVRQYLTSHIHTIASRYDGKVYSWDVVNEALNEDGTMRRSVFQQKLGDDFVVEAFRTAEKAAPHTKLYYNDYNIEEPAKRAGAIRLIRKIQAAGVRIDGVGIQGHWNISSVPFQKIEDSIEEFAALGIEVMFTELDLSVLPSPFKDNITADVNQKIEYNAAMNPYTNGLPDSVQQKLADCYGNLFRIFLKHKDKISRVTFWGAGDQQSWLNDWPVQGRTDYSLLFDRQLKPKPAFFSVINLKKTNL